MEGPSGPQVAMGAMGKQGDPGAAGAGAPGPPGVPSQTGKMSVFLGCTVTQLKNIIRKPFGEQTQEIEMS